MSPLVGSDSHPLHILFNSGLYNFVYTPVVPKVDDFGSFALEDTTHDINSCIVAVKEGGGRHHPDLILGDIGH